MGPRHRRGVTFTFMSIPFYHILHVFSLLALTGYTFYAFAAPPETRKCVLMTTGILSLLVLISGFGLKAKMVVGWPLWIIIKLVAWLGLSALAGIGYRKRDQSCVLKVVALVLILAALFAVYELNPQSVGR